MKTIKTLIFIFAIFSINTNIYSQLIPGLIHHYSFDAANAIDLVGTNDGTINGALSCPDRFGNLDMAFSFSSSTISVNTCNLGALTEASISIWLKPDTLPDGTIGGGIATPLFMPSWAIFLNRFTSDGRLIGIFDGSSLNNSFVDQSNQIPINEWVHLVVTNNGNTTKLYVNGVLEQSYLETFDWVDGANGMYLGGQLFSGSFTQYYNGKIDDFRIYKRAISLNEVVELYNLPNPVTSIDEQEISNQISVYPNPSNGNFNIKINDFETKSIDIVDLTGKIILRRTISNQTLVDLSSFADGMYIVRLSNDNGYIRSTRIIKSNK